MKHFARIAALSVPLFAGTAVHAGDFSFADIKVAGGKRTAFFMSHYPDTKRPFYFATTCADVLTLGVDRLARHYMVHFSDDPVMLPVVMQALSAAKDNCLGPTS